MCGIAGFYGFENHELIKKISSQLSHRGPDGEGIYRDNKATLLNRRLAIIDLKSGNQPIYNEDGSLVVVYNGEIYNYLELRGDLENLGHIFKTNSDTEIIVHAYEEWQEKCFDRLNGMFAIALYDKKKGRLLLVRDHFGIKPLYFSLLENNKLIFSSEIKPIFYSGLIEKIPNDKTIYRYLKFRIHDQGRETFFQNINRLLPGEFLEIYNSKIQIRKYTSLREDLLQTSRKQTKKNSSASTDQFYKELLKAVKYRLISDVPVGTCLSGGLDSSTLVSIINQLLKKGDKEAKSIGKIQKTFSAVFPGGKNDEEKYIDEVTKGKKLRSYKVFPKSKEFLKELKEFIRVQEEPTISTGPYAQYKVIEKAHNKVKVLLDGQGADEMMAGYMPYYAVYFRQLWKNKNYLKLMSEMSNSFDVISKYFQDKFTPIISPDKLMDENFKNKYKLERFYVENSNLKKRLTQDIFENSLQSLLRYEDRNSMRFSIEGRVPFLDFNLLRFLFSLDDEAIIKGGWNKYIMRKSTKKLLPDYINQRRNKIGFTTPEYQWFFELKKNIFEIFLSKSFSERKYFNRKNILISWQNFLDKDNTDTMIFWRLINVEFWLREFFDKKNNKVPKVHKIIKKELNIDGKIYERNLIKTDAFKRNDDYISKISNYVNKFLEQAKNNAKLNLNSPWFVVISEKIIAISQNRSYFIWDIHPGFWAKLLSVFVVKSPYGIGLGSPWTMQLAINEVGLLKILLAALFAALTKPLGLKGIFYKIVGESVRSIDGPTEYSLFPSNVSAKLGPKDPQKVSEKLKTQISNLKSESQMSNFLGVAIIDANDIGRNVLGNSIGLSNKLIEKIMDDNPMGQSDEQTPILIVQYK